MVKYHLKYKHIKRDTIKAIQDHWEKGFWKEEEDHKREVFLSLLSKLCEIYSIKKNPHLVILKDFNDGGMYISPLNLIIMNKYALITFLHEFKHFKDIYEGKRPNEENARGWSLSILFQVNPGYLKKIVEEGRVKFLTPKDIEGDIKTYLTQCPYCLASVREKSYYCYECGSKF